MGDAKESEVVEATTETFPLLTRVIRPGKVALRAARVLKACSCAAADTLASVAVSDMRDAAMLSAAAAEGAGKSTRTEKDAASATATARRARVDCALTPSGRSAFGRRYSTTYTPGRHEASLNDSTLHETHGLVSQYTCVIPAAVPARNVPEASVAYAPQVLKVGTVLPVKCNCQHTVSARTLVAVHR